MFYCLYFCWFFRSPAAAEVKGERPPAETTASEKPWQPEESVVWCLSFLHDWRRRCRQRRCCVKFQHRLNCTEKAAGRKALSESPSYTTGEFHVKWRSILLEISMSWKVTTHDMTRMSWCKLKAYL